MKYKATTAVLAALALGAAGPAEANADAAKFDGAAVIFPIGGRGLAEWFTGTVWVTPLVKRGAHNSYTVGDVKFEAGARTYWHTHPAGQILLCTDGSGFYQERGSPARRLKKGDAVEIPAGVEHWHGAAAGARFSHIAITNYKGEENVEWLGPVNEQDYAAANAQ